MMNARVMVVVASLMTATCASGASGTGAGARDGGAVPACGNDSLSGAFSPVGTGPGTFCIAMPEGLRVTHTDCRPQEVAADGQGDYYVSTGAPIAAFQSPGPITLGFAMDGRGLPCAQGMPACQLRGQCAATVVQGGGIGQAVEVVLSGPCALRQVDEVGTPIGAATLDRLRLRGVLRLGFNSNSSDGSVPADCR